MTRLEEAPVVSLEGVTKSYGGFTLGPVDLAVEPGYVVAVVGPNGSGKTTLFRLLMGLARPDAGEVRLFGRRYPEDEVAVKRRVGYVPERAVGHDDLTAREIGRFVSRWYPRWNEERYRELLRRFEIEPQKRFAKLSKGLQRRLSFAAAVACEPELLLLDEPTDGVDPIARGEMLDEISAFAGEGDRTVLLATHVMDEVRRVADYVAFLHRGRSLGLYEKDALLENWRVLWVKKVPNGRVADLPGVRSVEGGSPARLVTDSPRQTRVLLEERGVGILRTAPLTLDEILAHLVRREAP
jgi:ABC-2 type transport system ATP-binding protein